MKARCLSIAILAGLVLVPAAAAHITASPDEIPAGYTYTQFSVPHGCDGSPTTKLSIKIPAGIAGVKPEVVAGWKISTKEGQLEEPVSVFGEEVTEGVTEVSWTGGPLPDSQFQQFGLSFFASEDLVGQTVYWPIVQTCEQGVTRWLEIPVGGQEEPAEPAAGTTFLAAEEEHGGGGSDDEATTEEMPTTTEETETTAEAAVEPTSSSDSSSRADAALVLGGLGFAAGLAALGVALFRKPKSGA